MYRFMTGGYHDSGFTALMIVSRLTTLYCHIDTWFVTCPLWICHYELLYIYGINYVWTLNLEQFRYFRFRCWKAFETVTQHVRRYFFKPNLQNAALRDHCKQFWLWNSCVVMYVCQRVILWLERYHRLRVYQSRNICFVGSIYGRLWGNHHFDD